MNIETFKTFLVEKIKVFSIEFPRWVIAVLVWLIYLGSNVIERTLLTILVMAVWFFWNDYQSKNKGDKKNSGTEKKQKTTKE